MSTDLLILFLCHLVVVAGVVEDRRTTKLDESACTENNLFNT